MEVLVTLRTCSGRCRVAYLILDTNPKSAKQALERDRPSMLPPCNVVVRSDEGRTLCRRWPRPPGGQAQGAGSRIRERQESIS
jgi:Domain of unknown function DUF302